MIYVLLILQIVQLVIIVLMYIDFGASLDWIERYLGIRE